MYAREFEGKPHDFGVIGVEKGTLIMYDKQTNSRWSQLFGRAVGGPLKGKRLKKLRSTLTTWKKWRSRYPDTGVYVKRSIPYHARYSRQLFQQHAKKGAGATGPDDLVVGLEGHVKARAYPLRNLAGTRLVEEIFEGEPIIVYLSEDLTSAHVYSRIMERHLLSPPAVLSFEPADGDRLRDTLTGSIWDPVTGKALSGKLKGRVLQPLVHTYSVWFAWKKYRPDTTLFGE